VSAALLGWSLLAVSSPRVRGSEQRRAAGAAAPDREPGERIRILRVIGRLNVGGPAIHVVLLAERLDPARYESLVVTGREGPREGDYLALRGRSMPGLIVLPGLRRHLRPWTDLTLVVRLFRLIRRYRPHIVETHTAKAGALGRLAAWLARAPVILHIYHGHVFEGYFSPLQTRLYLAIDRWLARRTDCLVTVSERVRESLLTLGVGSRDRLVTVPSGLELGRFLAGDRLRGALRAELGWGPEHLLVGIVARLVPIKAHEVFLEAAARVVRRRPEARFVVVGDGERRLDLEALTRRLGLEASVRFLGWRQDLDRIYADLDVVALSSRNEGSPMCLIEAMAAGRAVVATRVGGVPDLVQEGVTGRLLESDDAAGLADTIEALLASPAERLALGRAAREHVRAAHSADRLLARMDDLYVELVRSRARRRAT
jgi:glycosyltransferase involved in cell wall biosynthesis